MAIDWPQDRILVVDDDAAARRTLQELLGQADYASVGVASVAEARRVAEGEEPTLALLDLVLPDGDGLRLLRDLRASWPAMPALIVTTCVETRSIVAAMRAGAFDYLTKPVDCEVLLSACRAALARRPSRSCGSARSHTIVREIGTTTPWPPSSAYLRPLRDIEDAYIDHVLAATRGNRTRAARILGVARETLRTRMLTRRAVS
jgi:DNA-binding NtrC family response regulator